MSKKKVVRYNGGTKSYLYSDKPDCLVIGKEYTVIRINQGHYYTTYELEGINGEFNSVWFNEGKKTFFNSFACFIAKALTSLSNLLRTWAEEICWLFA